MIKSNFQLLFKILSLLQLPRFLRFINKRKTIILLYHGFAEKVSNPELQVSIKEFEKQMIYLKRYYRIVPLENLWQSGNSRVVITIDDAYRSILYVVPILKRLKIPATLFIPTDFIENKDFKWEREHLKERGLTWSEIREIGFPIGSHTRFHTAFCGEEELAQSKEIIEKNIEKPCDFFAYPYGKHAEFNGETKKAVRKFYKCGLTTFNKMSDLSDMFELSRMGVDGRENMLLFEMKLCGIIEFFARIREKLARN